MLQIPISPFKTNEKPAASRAGNAVLPERETALRGELAEVLRACASPAQAGEQVTAWARSRAAELASSPMLQDDYNLLAPYFLRNAQHAETARRENALAEEENALISVGAKAADGPALAAYLTKRIASLEQKLKRLGLTKQEIEERLLALRRRAAEAACADGFMAEDLPRVCGLLAQFREDLSPEFVRSCEIKLLWQFAREQARLLWEPAQRLFPREPMRAAAWAREKNKEKNAVLRAHINEILTACEQAGMREQNRQQAQLLALLAAAPCEQAPAILAGQHILTPMQTEQYAQLCTRLDAPDEKTDVALFIKLYFDGIGREISQAYARGRLSARDFLRLESQQLFRTCGVKNPTAEIACHELKLLLEKKGFTTDEITRFQYELLTAADCWAAWEEIKKLISK